MRRLLLPFLTVTLLMGSTACSDESPAQSGGDEEVEAPDGDSGADEPAEGDDATGSALGALDDRQRSHLVEEGETTWDVSLRDDAAVVDGDALRSLTAIEGDRYVFDSDALAASGLQVEEGRTLLFAGRAVRRVTGVSADDTTTTVTTEPGSLSDVIDDGTVAWDVPIGFGFDQFVTEADDGDPIAAPVPGASDRDSVTLAMSATPVLTGISTRMPDGSVLPVTSGGDIAEGIWDSIEVKPEEGSVAWDYSADGSRYRLRLTSAGDEVDVLVVVSRGAEGEETMAFRAEGTIGSMRSTANSSWSGGELASSDVALEQLSTDLDVSLSVAGAGVSPIDFTIPVPMLTYTWLVGPVPVTLDLTAEIIGNVNAQANASATAEASFAYRGDAGFTFGGADVSTSGNTAIAEMDPEPADSAAAMSVNVDAQFGIGFPAVTLSVLGQGLVPELRVGHIIGSSLEWGGPAAGFPASSLCKRAYVRQIVSGGYEFTVLGRSLASNDEPFVLYEDERRTQGDSCPDEEP